MKSNEGIKPKSKNDANYEKNVLEFLNREIESSKPHHSEKKESEDLDQLVSNLLKQAIAESDMQGTPQADKKDRENTTAPRKPPYENRNDDSGATLSKNIIEQEFGQKTEGVPVSADSDATAETQKPVLTSVTIQKRKMSLIIAGVIGILAIAGSAAYLIYSNKGNSTPEIAQNNEPNNLSQTSAPNIEETSGTIPSDVIEQERAVTAINRDSGTSDTDSTPAMPSSDEQAAVQTTPPSPAQTEKTLKKEESPNAEPPPSNQSMKGKNNPVDSPDNTGIPAEATPKPEPEISPAAVKPEAQKPAIIESTAAPAPPVESKTEHTESTSVPESKPSPGPAVQEREAAGDTVSTPEGQDNGTIDIQMDDAASEAAQNASSEIQGPLAAITDLKEIQPPADRPGPQIAGRKDEVPPVAPRENSEDTRPEPAPSARKAPRTEEWIPAKLISTVKPSYPRIGLHARASGIVELKVSIDNKGKVTGAVPVSGPEMFYEEAVKAVMKWKYKPATKDGIDTASEIKIKIRFNAK